jgi:hypothetical protein
MIRKKYEGEVWLRQEIIGEIGVVLSQRKE